MNTVFKKVSIAALTLAMVLVNFGSVRIAHAALSTGDLVKGPNSDAVYYIDGTTKHVFPDRKTYFTWYTNFDKVKKVTVSELDNYATGAPVGYRAGTKLVTHPNTAKVYAVEPNGVLRWVSSEATAIALYGSNWGKTVNDVHELTFGNYTIGADMTSSAYSKGAVIQKTGDTTIYYYDGTNLRPFASTAAFDANNLNSAFIVKVASLPSAGTGSSITGAESFATISGSGTGTIIPSGPAGTLTVSLSPLTTPANQILIANAARVPMVTVRLTAGSNDVTVDSLTIERMGVAQDTSFTDFDILRGDNNLPLNNSSKSLNSTHQAVFNDDFTIPANSTWDVVVAANMANLATMQTTAGEYPAIAVVGIVLKNSSTLSGSLPIVGNVALTNGTLSVGAATVAAGSNAPVSGITKEVGTKDYIVTSLKVTNNATATGQDMVLKQITYTENGSASDTDIENMKLLNTNTGQVLATITAPTGKKITFNNLNVDVLKGNNVNFDLLVSIKNGSARTISFDIDQKADVVLWDKLRSANVLPTYPASSAPFYNVNDTTIGNGTLRIESVAVTPTNIPSNQNKILLGKFKFVAAGEAINITNMGMTLTLTTSTAGAVLSDLTSLQLVNPSGSTVAGPQDPAANGFRGANQNPGTATTTDTITVPIGETIYSVYGNLNNNLLANDKIQIGLQPLAITAKGDVSGNTITVTPTGMVSSTSLTVKAAALAVSVSTTPAANTIVAGAQNITAANIILDASNSGSDIRITSFKVPVATTGNAYPDIFTGIQLFSGTTEVPVSSRSTSYSTAATTAGGSGTTTLTISSGDLTVPAGQTKTITVIGDVGTGATSGSFLVGIQAGGISAIDSQAQTFNPTITASNGQAMTLSSGGTLNVALSTDPRSALVVGGSTVNVGQFTAQAKYDGLTVKALGFQINSPDGGISATNVPDQLSSLELWESGGSSALGTITVNGSRATITPSSNITFNINDQKTYIVKAKFATINGTATPAVSGGGVRVLLSWVDVTGNAAGSSSVTLAGFGSTNFNTFSSFKSVPTVTPVTLGSTGSISGTGTTVNLYKFSVTANSAGPIAVAKFTFGISTTTVWVSPTGYRVYESDSSGSLGNILSNTVDNVVSINPGDGLGTIVHARFDVNNDNSNSMNFVDSGEALDINAGATKYFTLQGTIGSNHDGTANNESIATVMAGDSAFAATSAKNLAGVDGTDTGLDDFIWSDLNFDLYSTSTATKTLGWFNGYRVSGLDDASSTPEVATD